MAQIYPSLSNSWYCRGGSGGWTAYHEVYAGASGGYNWRSRVQVDVGSFAGTSNWLLVSFTMNQTTSPAGICAVLSTRSDLSPGQVVSDSYYGSYTNGPHPSYLVSGCSGFIGHSESYSDAACTTQQTGYNQGSGHVVYFKFNSSAIRPNTTYYLYIMRNIQSGDSTSSGWSAGYLSQMGATLDYTLPTYTVTQRHYYQHVRNGWVYFNGTTNYVTHGSAFAPYNVTPPTGYYAGNNYGYYTASDSHLGDGTVGVNSFTVNQNINVNVHYYPNSYAYNFNILLPDGSEPCTTGAAGSIECSINGGSYSRIFNEAASSYPYDSTFHFINFTPGTGLYCTGITGGSWNSDGSYSATMGTSGLNINVSTGYQTYTNYIAHWKYVGTGGNNSDGTYQNMGTTSFNATYGSSVTIPSSHVQSYTGYHNTGSSGSYWGTSTWSNKTIGSTFTQPAGGVGIEYYYEPDTYTVSYNANGGSGAPSAQTKTYGVTLTLSSTTPTKASTVTNPTGTITVSYNANGGSSTPSAGTGTYTNTRTVPYTFKNWNTNSSGTGTSYNAGGSYTANAGATLYAQWNTGSATETRKTNPSIKTASSITRSNGSTTGYKITFNVPATASSAPSPITSTRTITYTFGGWNTNSSGTGTTYSANTSYTFSSNTTLYAKWDTSYTNNAITLPAAITRSNESATAYTVTLNANGGSCSTTSLSAARTTSYTFAGWNTNSSGTGTNYNAGASYTPSAAGTLYSKWNSSTSTAAVTLPTPTRSGYAFKGWSTSDTASSGTTGSYTPTGNVTLYATWQINTWTVSYNANGGTSSSVPASQTKTYNTTLTLSSTKPTRSDSTTTYKVTYNVNGGSSSHSAGTATKTTTYTFSKWNTAKDGSGTNYAAGASYTANAAATLYAQWSSSSSTTSVTLPTPTRTGYTFRGWSTSKSATSGTTGSYTPTGNVTLYATWAKNQITVNLKKDGSGWTNSGKSVSLIQSGSVVETLTASSGSSVVFSSGTYSGSYQVRVTGYSANYTSSSFTATYTSSQTVNFYSVFCSSGTGIHSVSGSGVYYSGESASISANVNTGYTWSSWSDGNTTRSRTITVSAKTSLTASATANTYTIQYLSTYGTGSTASSSHTYNSSKALTSNGFSRTGYTFLGWSKFSTATSATYTNGQSVKNLSSTNGATVKLYAVWELNATWDPTLKVYNTTTDVSSVAFGTRMVLTLNTSPSGTFPRYRVVTKIGSTVISDTQGTTETYNNITIPESSLSNVSSMSSSYTCYVVVYAIDAAGTSVLNKTFTFTHTLTEASKPTLTVTTELVDLTGICPGKELGRYTKLLIKPSIQFKYGAVLNEYEIFDPTGKSVYLTQVQNPSNYTTAPLDLSAFSGYYSTSDPKLSWVVKVWDSRGQEASTTVTQAVKYNIPADVHAYVPYIWSGSAWVKYTPEIASSNSISSSDIYVPFIKD